MAAAVRLPPIEVVSVTCVEELSDRLPRRSRYFTLLLAWDASEIDMERLGGIFGSLVDRGLAYICTWGKNCEAVHDVVDMCVVKKEIKVGEADYLLMTTWHARESLDEALWFFKMLAIPPESHVFADFDRFAVSVGNKDWADAMDRYISEAAAPNAEAQ